VETLADIIALRKGACMPRYVAVGGTCVEYLIFPDGREVGPQYGGNAIYSAMGMWVWDRSVGIVAPAGPQYPQAVIDALTEAGLDTRGVRRTRSSRSLDVKVTYKTDGSRVPEAPSGLLAVLQRHFPSLLGAIALPVWRTMCPQAEDIPDVFLDAQGAHICAYEYRSQARAIRHLRSRIRTITLDMPPGIPGVKPGMLPRELVDLSLPDFVLPSEQEISEFFGRGISAQEGADRLLSKGARNVVVKLGAKGSMVYEKESGKWRVLPIYRTTPQDITGAGDAYCGGFLVGIVETNDPIQACMYGTISASFVIEGHGGTYALRFTRAEAEERLARLRTMIAGAR
jgi:ribokinase